MQSVSSFLWCFNCVCVCVCCVEPTLPRSGCCVRHPMGARPNAGHSCGQLSFPFYFFSIVNTCILNANLTIPFHYLSTSICERRLCMSSTAHISSHHIQFAYGADTHWVCRTARNRPNEAMKWQNRLCSLERNRYKSNFIQIFPLIFYFIPIEMGYNGNVDMQKKWSHLLLVHIMHIRWKNVSRSDYNENRQ